MLNELYLITDAITLAELIIAIGFAGGFSFLSMDIKNIGKKFWTQDRQTRKCFANS